MLGKELTTFISGGSGADAWENFGEDTMFDSKENKYSESEDRFMDVDQSEKFMSEHGYSKAKKVTVSEKTVEMTDHSDPNENIPQKSIYSVALASKISYVKPTELYKENTVSQNQNIDRGVHVSVKTKIYTTNVPYGSNFKDKNESNSSSAVWNIINTILSEVAELAGKK